MDLVEIIPYYGSEHDPAGPSFGEKNVKFTSFFGNLVWTSK